MFETWRPVPGYEGLYSVSDIGRVRRESSAQGARAGRIKRAPIDAGGYRRVSLRRDGRESSRAVSRLVAAAFLGEPLPGQEARHLDGDSLNNCAENLAWGSKSQNERDKLVHGTHNMAKRMRCPRRHPLLAPNLVPSSLKSGLRGCLACSRATSHVRHHPELTASFQDVADRYYRELSKGIAP